MEPQNALSPLDPSALSTPGQGDGQAIQAVLWRLLSRRAALYTMDDSSSLPMETVQELYASLDFLLSLHLGGQGLPLSALLEGDPDALLEEAIARAEALVAEARDLYGRVLDGLPGLESAYLQDTLQGISGFFRRYDPRYFAHLVPCMIDYPLALPAPEALQGVCFLLTYLRRLDTEHRFLSRCPRREAVQVLDALVPGYRTLPLNLFDPPFTNALGRALLGLDAAPLRLTDGEHGRLWSLLAGLGPAGRARALGEGAESLARALCLDGPGEGEYLAGCAAALAPYIGRRLESGAHEGLFAWW